MGLRPRIRRSLREKYAIHRKRKRALEALTAARLADQRAQEALWQLLHVHLSGLEGTEQLAFLSELWEEEAEVLESFRRFDTWAEKDRWDTIAEIRTWIASYVLRDARLRERWTDAERAEFETLVKIFSERGLQLRVRWGNGVVVCLEAIDETGLLAGWVPVPDANGEGRPMLDAIRAVSAKVREGEVDEPEISSDLRPLTRLGDGQDENQEQAQPSEQTPEKS